MSKNLYVNGKLEDLEYIQSQGQRPVLFECTKCGWTGTDAEKKLETIDEAIQMQELQCPKCDNPDFYGLAKKDNDENK